MRTAAGSAMIAWKPRIEVAGSDAQESEDLWPTMMYFNLVTAQIGRTVLAGPGVVPIDAGWLCGSHWRQRVAGRVDGVSVDFGFDLDGLGGVVPPPLETGRTWRMDVGECTVSLLFAGGRPDETPARPRVAGAGDAWRISLLRKADFVLDWSDPPEVALAFVVDISPRGQAPRLEELHWEVAGAGWGRTS